MDTDIIKEQWNEIKETVRREYSLSNITVSTFTAVMLWVVIMLIIPIVLIVVGIVIWAVRRKK